MGNAPRASVVRHLPARWHIETVAAPRNGVALDAESASAAALARPRAGLPLRELAQGKRNTVIALDAFPADPLRQTLLRAVLRELQAEAQSQPTLLLAADTAPSPVDLPADLRAQVRLLWHDPQDQRDLDTIGVFEGITFWLNYHVLAADLLIAISVLRIDDETTHAGCYHTLLRLTARSTQQDLREARFFDGSAESGTEVSLLERALHELARRAGLSFALEALEDEQGRLLAVFAGMPSGVRAAMQRRIAELREAPVRHAAYDALVLAAPRRRPQSLFEAASTVVSQGLSPTSVLAHDGVLIVPVTGDMGDQSAAAQAFYDALTNADSPEQAVHLLRGRALREGEERAYLLAHLMQRHRVIAVGAPHERLARNSHFIPARNLMEALEITESLVDHPPRVLLIKRPRVTRPVFSPFLATLDDILDAHERQPSSKLMRIAKHS
ncbi:MAG: hypothetical protein RMJ86_04405 [Anaerolineae bacterium]|nr:hypothetical protein [Anaerolineae bacterium]MDW8293609.1 hypothetical protein [Anaerolineae bacterium]